jgi:O-antigen ligase
VLQPFLMDPTIGIALVGVALAGWLAWKSVAYPLALSGVPTLLDALLGSNPLPKGGVTFIFAAWIGLAVLFAVMRGTYGPALRALISTPVLISFTLLAVMLLRLGPSLDPAYGSEKIQLFIADNLIFMVGAIFVGSRRTDLRLALSIVLAITAFGALVLLFKLVTGDIHTTFAGRFSLYSEEWPIYLGRDSADGVIIAIYAILAATRLSTRMAAIAVLPVLIVAMLAAGSRGPVVAFAVGVVALLGLVAASPRARQRLLLVAGGLLGAGAIVPLALPSSSIGRALSTLMGSGTGLSSNGRTELWSEAFRGFSAHPLFGLGTGAFAGLNPEKHFPHNLFLEMAVELGLVGVVIIAAIVISFGSRLLAAWRAAEGRDKMDAAVLSSLFVMILVNSLFSGAIQDNWELWFWGGMGVGLSGGLATQRRKARLGRLLARRRARAAPFGVPSFGANAIRARR